MQNVIRDLADDIALGLVKEWRRRKAVPAPGALDMLVDQIAQESVSRQDNVQTSTFSERQILLRRLEQIESTVDQIVQESVGQQENVQANTFSEQQIMTRRLQQVENTLEKLATRLQSGQGKYEAGSDLDGEGSKYQNVETMLKYVDGSGAEGGVKLVIMNFND